MVERKITDTPKEKPTAKQIRHEKAQQEQERLEQELDTEKLEANRKIYELPPHTKFVSVSASSDGRYTSGGIVVVYKPLEEGEQHKPESYYVDTGWGARYKVVEK